MLKKEMGNTQAHSSTEWYGMAWKYVRQNRHNHTAIEKNYNKHIKITNNLWTERRRRRDGAINKNINISRTTKMFKSACRMHCRCLCTDCVYHFFCLNDAIYTPYNIRLLSVCVWRVKRNARLLLAMIDFLLRLLILHDSRANSKVACCQFGCYCCASSIFILISSNTSHARTRNCLVSAFIPFEQAGRQAGTICDVRLTDSEMKLMCDFSPLFLFLFRPQNVSIFVIMDAMK